MIGAELDIDSDVLDAVRSTVGQSAAVMRTLQRRRVSKVKAHIKEDFKAPESLPDLPFIWSMDAAANARARRWYFANMVDKGSAGGRYQRTGAIEAAWDIQFIEDDNGAAITIENNAPGAEFVYGNRQVPSHYLTGWNPVSEIAARYRDELNLRLIEDWLTASSDVAGVE